VGATVDVVSGDVASGAGCGSGVELQAAVAHRALQPANKMTKPRAVFMARS
jgi:hypothetical protein